MDRFFSKAYRYVREHSDDELRWARQQSASKFRRFRASDFLAEYAWVVYVAGFRVATIEKKFPALTQAFKNFDIERLRRIRSLKPVLRVFGNRARARSFLRGAQMISEEGFSNFKKRVAVEGPDALVKLPGIGPITKNHLARNVGLASVAKNDIWVGRLVKLFRASSHTEMVEYLSRRHKMKPGVVDLILWRFCADHGWKWANFSSLEHFVQSL